MAAPPYLTTAVRPAKRLIHGRASCSTAALACSSSGRSRRVLIGDAPLALWLLDASGSCGVLRVEAHVLRGEVGGAHARPRAGPAEGPEIGRASCRERV